MSCKPYPYTAVCQCCGKSFEGVSFGNNRPRKYCSEDCKSEGASRATAGRPQSPREKCRPETAAKLAEKLRSMITTIGPVGVRNRASIWCRK